MKVLLLVVLIIGQISSQARELTTTEKIAVFNLTTANSVTEFMSENIDTDKLTKKEYIIFQALKRGCYPINKELELIANANEGERGNRLQVLSAYAKACKESALSLSNLYIKYHN